MRARLLSLLALAAAFPAWAAEPNVISSVEAKDTGPEVVVTVKGTRKPSFTTFSMADPPRFVIDFSESRFQGVAEESRGAGGVVQLVKCLSYGAGASAIARVMIAFSAEVDPPSVEESADGIAVRVTKPGGAAVAAAPAAPAAPAAVATAAVPDAQAQADALAKADADAKARADAEAKAAAQARAKAEADAQAKADAEAKAAEAKVKADADASAAAKALAKADADAKAKADAEAKAAADAQAKADTQARAAADSRARAEADAKARADAEAKAAADAQAKAGAQAKAAADAKARAEADAKARADSEAQAAAAQPAEEDDAEQRALEAEIAAARAAPGSARMGAAPRAAAAKVEKLSPQASPGLVREVGFQQLPDASRVFVRTSSTPTFTIQEVDERTVRIEVENAPPPRHNDLRFLDTSFFASAVQLVTPSRQGTSYVLTVKLRQRVPYQQKVEGDTLTVDFQRLPASASADEPRAPGQEPAAEAPASEGKGD